MALLNAIRKARPSRPQTVVKDFSESNAAYDNPDRLRFRADLDAFKGWVYACVTAIASAVAAVPLHLYDADEEEVENHPFLELWDKPSRLFYRQEWVELTMIHLLLAGNAYWLKLRNPKGGIYELFPLIPNLVKIIPSEELPDGTVTGDGLIGAYEYTTGKGKAIRFAPDEVVHFKLPNSGDIFYGLGVAQAAGLAVDMDTFIMRHGVATFRNGARPDVVWTFPPGTPESERRKFAKVLDTYHKGADNAKRSMVAVEGITPVELKEHSPKELDYLKAAEFVRDQIFAIFSVPRSVVGMVDQINLANADEGNITMAKMVLKPNLERLRTRINREILPEYPGDKINVQFEEVIPEDESQRSTRLTSLGSLPIAWVNEVRETAGLDADDTFDGYVIQGGELVKFEDIDNPQETEAPPGGSLPAGQNPPAGGGNATGEENAEKPKSKALAPVQKRVHDPDGAQRILDELIAEMHPEVAAYFEGAKKRTMGRLRNESKSVIKGNPSDAFNRTEEWKKLRDILSVGIRRGYARALAFVRHLLGEDEQQAEEDYFWADQRADTAAELMIATMEKRIQAAIGASQVLEEDPKDMREQVAHQFDVAISSRSQLAALTESVLAFNTGAFNESKRQGLNYKVWVTADDDHVEPICAANEAEGWVPIDHVYAASGTESPPAPHYGCRCALSYEHRSIGGPIGT